MLDPDRFRLLGVYLGERGQDVLLLGADVAKDGVLQRVPGIVQGRSVVDARGRPQLFEADLDALVVIGAQQRFAGKLIVD